MPKPSEDAKEAFRALLPDDPAINLRPMFGNLSAFVNGNMFAGLFGDDLFVRLSDSEQARLLDEGGSQFEPMGGRPMKGYINLPQGWRQRLPSARDWIERSLEWSRHLPPKKPAAKKASRTSP